MTFENRRRIAGRWLRAHGIPTDYFYDADNTKEVFASFAIASLMQMSKEEFLRGTTLQFETLLSFKLQAAIDACREHLDMTERKLK